MNFLNVGQKKPSVVELLHKKLSGYEPPRPITRIHASDLTKSTEFCPRERALMLELGVKPKGEYIDPATQTTFDEGWDKQWRLNNDWLREYMVGNWECTKCKDTKVMTKAPKGGKCANGCNWEYLEPRFVHPVAKVSGSIDGFVDFGTGRLRFLECKILKGDDFKVLKAPMAEHNWRTKLYLKIIAESGTPYSEMIDTDYGFILYVCRGYGFKHPELGVITPFKEFIVHRDDSQVETEIGKAHALTMWREDRKLGLPFGVCSNMICKRATACLVAKECFSGEHEARITWTKKGQPVHEGAAVVATGKA